MRIKITSDSTVDMTPELLKEYEIDTFPLIVMLGDNQYYDDKVTPQMIYDFEKSCGKLPKTAGRTSIEFQEFFQSFLDAGYDAVIHFSISSKISVSNQEAAKAAQNMKNVFVVDSLALSSGTALLAMDAVEKARAGMMPEDIVERAHKRLKSIQTSFIIDRLDFLYKGGRCSKLALLGANLLKIKPTIEMVDGKLDVGKKFRGKQVKTVEMYVESILERFNTPDNARCFLTHTEIPGDIVDTVKKILAEKTKFREVLETTAGSTITSHCGKGTLGILYINDGGES